MIQYSIPPSHVPSSHPSCRSRLKLELKLVAVGTFLGVACWPQPSAADVVTDWNNAALEAIKTTRDNPPMATRKMAIEHIAIFDAVNGIQRDFQPYHVTERAPAGASIEAAIAAAAHTALHALYTDPAVRADIFLPLYGDASGSLRTGDQTEIALFWNDDPGTESPPGHWNAIAAEVSAARGLTLLENVRLFAVLNIALADAGICAWDSKFAYDYWRPIDGIREADTDGNPETEADPTWTPLIFMPPFPEYTSGHSTFSRSAASILASIFGTDAIPFTTGSRGTPGVMRSYPGFSAAADEAGISRIYGGIHFYSANYHGQASAHALAKQVLAYSLQPLNSLRFTHVGHADGTTELEFVGQPDQQYLVRASSDLQTWETIGVLSSDTGVIRFTDPNASGALRFYVAESQ